LLWLGDGSAELVGTAEADDDFGDVADGGEG